MEAGSLKGIEGGIDLPGSTETPEEIDTGFTVIVDHPEGGISHESTRRILDGIGTVTDDPEYRGKLNGDGVKTQLEQVDPRIIAQASGQGTEMPDARDGTWN